MKKNNRHLKTYLYISGITFVIIIFFCTIYFFIFANRIHPPGWLQGRWVGENICYKPFPDKDIEKRYIDWVFDGDSIKLKRYRESEIEDEVDYYSITKKQWLFTTLTQKVSNNKYTLRSEAVNNTGDSKDVFKFVNGKTVEYINYSSYNGEEFKTCWAELKRVE